MAEVVPAPYPTADSKLVRIPEGISAGDRFKFAWDGSSISVKCPEGKGAGDEMKVDAPTADHRSLINGLASKAIHDLTKPTTEKRQKLEHMTAEHEARVEAAAEEEHDNLIEDDHAAMPGPSGPTVEDMDRIAALMQQDHGAQQMGQVASLAAPPTPVPNGQVATLAPARKRGARSPRVPTRNSCRSRPS